jgi:hypothetical protein
VVSDFVLEIDLQSNKDYDHRSMVLVFGYQDPAIFTTSISARRPATTPTRCSSSTATPDQDLDRDPPGTAWDDAWHKVKTTTVERRHGDSTT